MGIYSPNLSITSILPIFMEYRDLEFALNYLDMARLETKGVKPRYNLVEPGPSTGDNTDTDLISSPMEEGEQNCTRGMVF